MSNWITLNDMYNYAKDNNLKLLSNYSSTFWSEYISNSSKYDKLFNRMYSSFRYFYQDEDSVVNELTTDFIDEVYNHLLINDKKYSELYRVHILADANYSITDNVNLEEKMDRDKNTSGSYTEGTRQDDYTNTTGSRSDSNITSIGARTDTSETQVSAFNSSSYSNQNKITDINGSQSNSETFTKGQEIDTSRLVKSSQINSTDMDFTDDYTLTKKGKMGDKTVSSMLQEHLDVWTPYQFYTFIFKELCAELLLV